MLILHIVNKSQCSFGSCHKRKLYGYYGNYDLTQCSG